jgi:Tfp pilus assembly protein FimT
MIPKARRADGYTLFELVMVIVIIGFMSATVAVGISAQANRATINDADTLRKNLAHVQALGLGWGARLRVTSSSSGYSVTCRTALSRSPCNAVGDTATDPATGTSFSVTLSSGVSLSQSGGTTNTTLDFDSMGRPTGTTNLLSTNTTYTVSSSGRTVTMVVAPITGFVTTTY